MPVGGPGHVCPRFRQLFTLSTGPGAAVANHREVLLSVFPDTFNKKSYAPPSKLTISPSASSGASHFFEPISEKEAARCDGGA